MIGLLRKKGDCVVTNSKIKNFLVLFFLLFGANVTATEILNAKTTPVKQAVKFAGKAAHLLKKVGKDNFKEEYENLKTEVSNNPKILDEEITPEEQEALNSVIPNFAENYKLLQDKCAEVLTVDGKEIPRIEMPVIEPEQIEGLIKKLEGGEIDINFPHIKNIFFVDEKTEQYIPFPKDLKNNELGRLWLILGTLDKNPDDDRVDVSESKVASKDLKITQSQIWTSKLIFKVIKPKPKRIIISKGNWIVDGHHEYGRRFIKNPDDKIPVYTVDLDIQKILKAFRSVGNALGNKQKA